MENFFPNDAGHVPVLLDEALEALGPRSGEVHVDATFGGGGYSRAILAAADCRVIGLDRDPTAVARGRRLAAACPRFTMVHGRFGDLPQHLAASGVAAVDGVVADLGMSSFQLDDPTRGFAFAQDGPLDMRMGGEGPTAADLLRDLDEAELARTLRELGDEPDARRVARAIVARRRSAPIRRTSELRELVRSVKGHGRPGHDPATRTFQALRLAVNDEPGELMRLLAAALAVLRPGGRLVVVTFHSGEDRVVKRFIDRESGRGATRSRHLPPTTPPPARLAPLGRGGVAPSAAEVERNPRARSARLRAAVRLADTGERVVEAGELPGTGWRQAA